MKQQHKRPHQQPELPDGVDLLYVPDLAKALNMTESAIRSAWQQRAFNRIPRPRRHGRRLAWTREDVQCFIAGLPHIARPDGETNDGNH